MIIKKKEFKVKFKSDSAMTFVIQQNQFSCNKFLNAFILTARYLLFLLYYFGGIIVIVYYYSWVIIIVYSSTRGLTLVRAEPSISKTLTVISMTNVEELVFLLM